jgi:enamine deaminase RidA (YjgF/YER057c/UK114 family)
LQGALRTAQVALSVQRHDISVNNCHKKFSEWTADSIKTCLAGAGLTLANILHDEIFSASAMVSVPAAENFRRKREKFAEKVNWVIRKRDIFYPLIQSVKKYAAQSWP